MTDQHAKRMPNPIEAEHLLSLSSSTASTGQETHSAESIRKTVTKMLELMTGGDTTSCVCVCVCEEMTVTFIIAYVLRRRKGRRERGREGGGGKRKVWRSGRERLVHAMNVLILHITKCH